MSAPVKQVISDHLSTEVEPECAHPDDFLADVNWVTAFEYGDAR